MVRKELRILELKDEHIDPEITPENVIWLSRHVLTSEQELAIYYLHRKNVRIERVPNIVFVDEQHLAQVIEFYSRKGTVYLVAPEWMIQQVRQKSPRLTFRIFAGYIEPVKVKEKFNLISVQEINGFGRKVILWQNELEEFRSRERVGIFSFSR
ncbi:MAG: hypothetical protein COV08_03490 [Candidatus Vogelbacteria bacterium CG10_big_fil_rev_8_21_14_0_10_49_38]|uniref:Uncharacterized protein n=1 Tax=Candidatus Vogelbacteria bacterium CG10_big_fil_rev_8_21_14_0_10_49_38 TaxID=1975043 RepID=A0A2H0RI46_9BACT|nr:MAG: hypothetical protein BK006_03480 [bacterium CG10_49_38]PIR45704.1 MAG: hypothetical protein COV08_03490 [Candidatus Vogelbacteria bacterium CG10_big_fil_rev_8_21_14_0_10_49_38]